MYIAMDTPKHRRVKLKDLSVGEVFCLYNTKDAEFYMIIENYAADDIPVVQLTNKSGAIRRWKPSMTVYPVCLTGTLAQIDDLRIASILDEEGYKEKEEEDTQNMWEFEKGDN